jgi:hypothetical protein
MQNAHYFDPSTDNAIMPLQPMISQQP